MVFERQIEVSGKKYWILEHTVRKGKRFQKKTDYIGKTLPSKARLEQLKKEFLKEIAGQRYKYLAAEDVKKIEDKKAFYEQHAKRLSKTEKEKHFNEFIVRFTYDSSKLSGVAVTLRQTSLILEEGIMPESIKSLKTARGLENHKKGIIAMTKYKGNLDARFIKKLHSVLFAGIDDEIAGRLRSELKRNVKIAGTAYVPPAWQSIEKELNTFFGWYHAESRKMHALELAALVHLKIISIQPFADGNSRLSRLLMNWILWKKNYPMIDIPIEDLEEYYDVLDRYQIEKNERPFIKFIENKYLKSEY